MNRIEKVLVTGATGLLGPYIVADLIEQGYINITVLIRSGKLNKELQPYTDYLTVVKGDILELFPLSEIVDAMDYVVHVAAMVSFDPRDKKEMYAINVSGTANVANLCLSAGVKKLVHISSVAAIGRAEKVGIISEDTKWSESTYNPYYGVTKYKSELEVWRAHTEGLPVAIVNPSIILGQGDYYRSSLKMVDLVARGLSHYPVGSVGIVDARDVARLSVLLMDSDINGERYIATADSVSYQSLFEKIAIQTGAKPPPRPMTPLLGNLLWRLEKLRSFVTRRSPIVTRETIASSSYPAQYDTSKSRALDGFVYRDVQDTIDWTCKGYVAAKKA